MFTMKPIFVSMAFHVLYAVSYELVQGHILGVYAISDGPKAKPYGSSCFSYVVYVISCGV